MWNKVKVKVKVKVKGERVKVKVKVKEIWIIYISSCYILLTELRTTGNYIVLYYIMQLKLHHHC